jgi:regulator of protease activity HflC (stomatin/prohibitin superfamily)
MKFNLATIIGVILAIVIITALSTISVIEAGSVGITDIYGTVSDKVLEPGIHFFNLPGSVHTIPTRLVREDIKLDVKAKDGTSVTVDAQPIFSIDAQSAPELYRTIKPFDTDTISKIKLENLILSDSKAILAEVSPDEINENQAKLTEQIAVAVRQSLADNRSLNLDQFTITGFSFPEAIQDSINAKAIAKQNLQRAETTKQQAIVEAETNTILSKSYTKEVALRDGIAACRETKTCILMPSPTGYGAGMMLNAN